MFSKTSLQHSSFSAKRRVSGPEGNDNRGVTGLVTPGFLKIKKGKGRLRETNPNQMRVYMVSGVVEDIYKG